MWVSGQLPRAEQLPPSTTSSVPTLPPIPTLPQLVRAATISDRTTATAAMKTSAERPAAVIRTTAPASEDKPQHDGGSKVAEEELRMPMSNYVVIKPVGAVAEVAVTVFINT